MRIAMTLLITCIGVGCTEWHTTDKPLPVLLQGRAPEYVRISRRNGSRVTLHFPGFSGDTLVGDVDQQVVRIPLDSIQRIQTSRLSVPKTLAVLGVIGVATYVGIASQIRTK